MKKIKPKAGQESVWDYPRPPAIQKVSVYIKVIHDGQVLFEGNNCYRILETSHPPTYYLPKKQFKEGVLIRTDRSSFCEFKGRAHYYHIESAGKRLEFAAWGYDEPNTQYSEIAGLVSVYANQVDECYVGDERVEAQEGDFYGGWITSAVVGPFKGGAGTWGW